MTRRLLVDLETTGDGSNLFHDILQISARYYENEKLVAEFNADYAHNNSSVFSMGINQRKAHDNKTAGCKSSKEGIIDFDSFLKKHLGGNKCFLISYNCEWDERHLKNWFRRNKLSCLYFFNPCLCIMGLCAFRFDKFMSLPTCCEKTGVPYKKEKLHNARYDLFLATEVYKRLLVQMKKAA